MEEILTLTKGVTVPKLGFGTWQLTGVAATEAVAEALKVGYRHIDTADGYGNHREVGEGISRSGVPREEIFITTKLVYPDGYTAAAVMRDGSRFLEELQVSYADLLLIHWPNRKVPFAETLGAMEVLKKEGKIRAIGVSNFTERHLEEALESGVEIVNNQVEVRPQFNQKALRDYCASKNISITAYSSLKGEEMALPLFEELAKKYQKTPAQIILNWVMARGMIAIPKSAHPERIKENFDSARFDMEEEDLLRIDTLPQTGRVNDPAFSDFEY
jgi:diketogulonate reductase-like aldo/keto reductase